MMQEKKFEDLKEAKQDPKGGKKPTADMIWLPQRVGPVEPQGPSD